jgi:hypothetical protein
LFSKPGEGLDPSAPPQDKPSPGLFIQKCVEKLLSMETLSLGIWIEGRGNTQKEP